MQYGFNGAIQASKVVFNAIDKCQYQNNTDFVNCAHEYFYGFLTVCNGTRYGCETHISSCNLFLLIIILSLIIF
jgi:hypothetical protein